MSGSRANVVGPPFAVLGLGAAVAWLLGRTLASALSGEWFSMENIGYAIAWGGYALFAGLFLWLDARAARRLPDGVWRSREAMWRSTLVSAAKALLGALPLGLLLVMVVSDLARAHSPATGVVIVAVYAVTALWILRGVFKDVGARRRTRLADGGL